MKGEREASPNTLTMAVMMTIMILVMMMNFWEDGKVEKEHENGITDYVFNECKESKMTCVEERRVKNKIIPIPQQYSFRGVYNYMMIVSVMNFFFLLTDFFTFF